MAPGSWFYSFLSISGLFLSSCSPAVKPTGGEASRVDYYGVADHQQIKFQDEVETNVEVIDDLTTLNFVDLNGKEVKLKDFVGKKNVVLVMTRGYSGSICLYCSTQTARLISRYDEIASHDAEVVTVFPVNVEGDKDRLDEFIASTEEKLDEPVSNVPFPLLIDIQLRAVDQLGIRQSLSKPATYILDKKGQVRFAYVGQTIADRPSVDAIVNQLAQLNQE